MYWKCYTCPNWILYELRNLDCTVEKNDLTLGQSNWRASDRMVDSLYCTYPNYCFHHPSLTRRDILPLPSVGKRNGASAAGDFLPNWRASSRQPPREARRVRRGRACRVC